MADYATRRLENIKRNEALVKGLGLQNGLAAQYAEEKKQQLPPPQKRRKVQPAAAAQHTSRPTRSSARIANAPSKPSYAAADEDETAAAAATTSRDAGGKPGRGRPKPSSASSKAVTKQPATAAVDIASLRASWTSWTPTQPPPTLDAATGTYFFASHPTFRPNKSPEQMLREGCFGGSYFRPLYSAHLRATIADDWEELPAEWTKGLDVGRYLVSEVYDPEVNKYGVKCGQSIEEWEKSGWIRHEYDVRGWFQWYCRFWMGRRLGGAGGGDGDGDDDDGDDGGGSGGGGQDDEDERQIGRWKRCVGPGGRWRRTLLKKYVQRGIRSVMDEDGGEREDDPGNDVSPVVHQTCHHWAWEVRQEDLDRFWEEGR